MWVFFVAPTTKKTNDTSYKVQDSVRNKKLGITCQKKKKRLSIDERKRERKKERKKEGGREGGITSKWTIKRNK